MPMYTAREFLVHKGDLVAIGSEVELTAHQAERLGEKVVLSSKAEAKQVEEFESTEAVAVSPAEPTEDADLKDLEDMTVKELEAEAKTLGIKGYSNMDRDELIEAIENEE